MAVSTKRNSPTDVISRISQISKIMRERRLWFAVLLEKNYVTELFLEIFRNFHLIIINIFMKSGYISSLLVALQPVRCKPESLVEREFLAVLRRATFGKYIPRNSVLYKTVDWIPVTLPKCDSIEVIIQAILKISGNIYSGASFQCSYRW